MMKIVTKSIKQIQFHDYQAILEGKYSGHFLFWVMVILGGISLPGGIILGIAAEEMLLLLIFGGLGALLLIMAFFSPIFEWFELDQANQSFKFCTASMTTKKDPAKAKIREYSFNSLTIDWEANRMFKSVVILIQAQDRSRFTLTLPHKQHAALMEWLKVQPDSPQPESPDVELGAEIPLPVEILPGAGENLYQQKDVMGYATMLKEIASWGRSSLLLGVVHIVASGFLNPGWGVTLLAVGGLSFIFKDAAMFVLYAVALVWVGISNMMSMSIGTWTLFGIYQIYLGVRLFQKFKRYRGYQVKHLASTEDLLAETNSGKAAKLFPWVGVGLSIFGSVVYFGVWIFLILAMIVNFSESQDPTLSDSLIGILDLIAGVALGFGIVGLGLSLAALLSKFIPKWAAWTGIIFGALLILFEVIINIWVALSA